MNAKDLTIHDAQRFQPWTVPYSYGTMIAATAQLGGIPHILGSHAVLHGMKSLGKIAAVYEALDHRDTPATVGEVSEIANMAADLLTIAMRLANLHSFSLAQVLVYRVQEKNGVDLVQTVDLALTRAAKL